MQNHEVSRIPLITHRPFAKFATEPVCVKLVGDVEVEITEKVECPSSHFVGLHGF